MRRLWSNSDPNPEGFRGRPLDPNLLTFAPAILIVLFHSHSVFAATHYHRKIMETLQTNSKVQSLASDAPLLISPI